MSDATQKQPEQPQAEKLDRLNVHIRLEATADAALVQDLRPDTVIVATGSTPRTEP